MLGTCLSHRTGPGQCINANIWLECQRREHWDTVEGWRLTVVGESPGGQLGSTWPLKSHFSQPRLDWPGDRVDFLLQGKGKQKIPTSPYCHNKHLCSILQENKTVLTSPEPSLECCWEFRQLYCPRLGARGMHSPAPTHSLWATLLQHVPSWNQSHLETPYLWSAPFSEGE